MRQIFPDIPHLNYILWTCTYPVELVLGLAGYIAMIVADMPSEPTDRANHYFVGSNPTIQSIFFCFYSMQPNFTMMNVIMNHISVSIM
jgi:hypothetical protein